MRIRITGWILAMLMLLSLVGCGASKTVPLDYGDAGSFEADLNAGKDLAGKTVTVLVEELQPQSAFGYNIWAGEHLNFVSSENPGVEVGQTVTVRATKIESLLSSWIIQYEKTEAKEDEHTIFMPIPEAAADSEELLEKPSERPSEEPKAETGAGGTASFAVGTAQNRENQPVELKDCGWYIYPPSSGADSAYIYFCGMLHNPNETAAALYPELIVTVRRDDNSIAATGSQMGGSIMPGDTVTMTGHISIPLEDLNEGTRITFDIDCYEFSAEKLYRTPRTTDFLIENVSERSGREYLITGEVTNLTAEDVDTVNIAIVLRKDGEIVFMDSTFLDHLTPGKAKAFQMQRYTEWPEHDTIDVSVQAW